MKKVLQFSALLLVLASCTPAQRTVQKCKRVDVIYNYLISREIQKGNVAKVDSLNSERENKITKYTKS